MVEGGGGSLNKRESLEAGEVLMISNLMSKKFDPYKFGFLSKINQ
jgi:hypothetical protein